MTAKKKDSLVIFWLLNIINALCTGGIIFTAFLNFADQGPSEVFHIGVYAIYEAAMAFYINLLLYRISQKKEKE
jgi:hypothetical protein